MVVTSIVVPFLQASHGVLEVVEYTGDGTVLVLGSQGRVADVAEGDVELSTVVIRVRNLHVGEVVLEIKHLGVTTRSLYTLATVEHFSTGIIQHSFLSRGNHPGLCPVGLFRHMHTTVQ